MESRFGIGEWFGESFVNMSPEMRIEVAEKVTSRSKYSKTCPFRTSAGEDIPCNKRGGVCSLRQYTRDTATGEVIVSPGEAGNIRTTCPNRFEQDQEVYKWVAEILLGSPIPVILGEIGFLEGVVRDGVNNRSREDVGRIDNVLVHSDLANLDWCALEKQAVYFSGDGMVEEFRALLEPSDSRIPFPRGRRRPDYRSSGPKRLMPQLQIKIPPLRRWGKKMAVVVDEAFFSSLGEMDEVADVSNCDIAWFVVKYTGTDNRFRLERGFVQLTTLERAVEGLTGGRPVSLDTFEDRIRRMLEKRGLPL